MQQTLVPVDVRDICFEKNLYEIKNLDGSFIAQNAIENTFGSIEQKVDKVIQSIQAKSLNENCLRCTTVLSDDDKNYLTIFVASLLFRDPKTIESGIGHLQKSNPNITTREARNFTLLNLLPLGLDSEWDKNTIIRTALDDYSGMAFQIGMTDEDTIITSDRPVVIWPKKDVEPYTNPKAVSFPLTSRLLLFLFPAGDVNHGIRDCFFKLTKEQINDSYGNVSAYARNWIYSRNPLTQEQVAIIQETRNKMNCN